MNRTVVRAAVVHVLQEIQTLSGEVCPDISDTTKPIEDLPKFDSKVWPVAFGLIGLRLGVNVPLDVNVFREEHTKTPNTIEQTVTAILKAIRMEGVSHRPLARNAAEAIA